MRAVRRPAVLLSALALAVGGLSGCGDDEPDGSDTMTIEPRDPSSSTGSSSASSSSSSGISSSSTSAKGDAPEIPAEAKKHTDEGAVAFAEHYWSETGRALEASDTTHLKELSSDCLPCDEYVGTVEAEKRKGQRADRNPISIRSSTSTDETDGKSEKAVTLEVDDAAYEMLDKSGKAVSSVDPVSYDLIVYLDKRGATWTVVDLLALT